MPKAEYLNKYLRQWKRFDKVLHQVKFLKADKGSCVAAMKIEEEHLNVVGTLHGGYSATLVDSVSGLGLMSLETWETPSVSTNLNLTYMGAAKAGEEITIHSNLLRAGKNVAFLDVEIRNAANKLLVKAEHTKFKVLK